MPRKSNFDAVREYYLSEEEIELTPRQEELRKRLSFAFSALSKFHTQSQVADMVSREFSISRAQAYRVVSDSIALFGDVRQTTKEGIRTIVSEMAMVSFQMAREKKSLNGMNAAVANLIKIHGLDKESVELPDFDKFAQSLYALVLAPQVERFVDGLLQGGGALNLSEAVPFTDFEELLNDDSEGESQS